MSDQEQTYPIVEVFATRQGEGHYLGQRAVFVRFGGCNLDCQEGNYAGFKCDTPWQTFNIWSARALLLAIEDCFIEAMKMGKLSAEHHDQPIIVFTGGEPMLSLDEGLLEALCEIFLTKPEWAELPHPPIFHLETNGEIPLSKQISAMLSYVACSPHRSVTDIAIRRIDEIRIVQTHHGFWERAKQGLRDWEIIGREYGASHYFLSPRFLMDGKIDREAFYAAHRLTEELPAWQLSIQSHKLLGDR